MDTRNEMPELALGRMDSRVRGRRRPNPATMAAIRQSHNPARPPATMAAISPLPPPEEVFADWLLSVPHGADLRHAARRQIALIDRRRSLHPDVQVLRVLLAAVAGTGVWTPPVSNL